MLWVRVLPDRKQLVLRSGGTVPDDQRYEPLFEERQQLSAVGLLGDLAWLEFDARLVMMEEALRRALLATERDARAWDAQIQSDVFDVPGDVVQHLVPVARMAYVARVMRSLAFAYGGLASGEQGTQAISPMTHDHSPAALLRGLNDIVWLDR